MAKSLKSALTLLLLLLSSSLFFFVPINEARPMRASMIEREIVKVLDDLYVEGIKTGGPSHAGDGHSFTLGGIKNSGPSPGAGN
ncbi:hypothetical protein ACS0TY_023532 [Phlomoides rotata]